MSKPASKRYIHYCPHCGEDAKLHESVVDSGFWYVMCDSDRCACRTKTWRTANDAINAWNARISESGDFEITDLVDKIRGRIADMSDDEIRRYQEALNIHRLETPFGTLCYIEPEMLRKREEDERSRDE